MDTVMNFFALSIIHEIDNLYADSLPKELPLKKNLIEKKPERSQSTQDWRNEKVMYDSKEGPGRGYSLG